MKRIFRNSKGFSAIELLIALALTIILMSSVNLILTPAISGNLKASANVAMARVSNKILVAVAKDLTGVERMSIDYYTGAVMTSTSFPEYGQAANTYQNHIYLYGNKVRLFSTATMAESTATSSIPYGNCTVTALSFSRNSSDHTLLTISVTVKYGNYTYTDTKTVSVTFSSVSATKEIVIDSASGSNCLDYIKTSLAAD